MTILELKDLLGYFPDSTNVYLQPMAKDPKRPCKTVVNSDTGVVLTSRDFRTSSAKKGGRR